MSCPDVYFRVTRADLLGAGAEAGSCVSSREEVTAARAKISQVEVGRRQETLDVPSGRTDGIFRPVGESGMSLVTSGME